MTFSLPGALDVLVSDMGWTEADARNILGNLQVRLEQAFDGLPWLPSTEANVLDFLEAAFPAPDTHRWSVSHPGTGTAYCNLVPVSGIPLGYSFAARVTIGFDGGNHALKGDLWKHDHCGCLIFPGDHQVHERFHAELRGQAA